jgi:hypothetical protein
VVERSPSYEEYETEVLRNATEDLDLVLIAWWIANTLYPAKPVSERLAAAERAIRSLANAGLIALYRDRQMDADHEIPAADYEDVLRRWDTWTGVTDDPHDQVFFAATDAGRESYRDRVSHQ